MKSLPAQFLRILAALIATSVLLVASMAAQPLPASQNRLTGTPEQAAPQPTIGNPAAVYCTGLGYEYGIVDQDGQRGICTLPDGLVCDAWAFLQGKCGQSFSLCAQQGYGTATSNDGQDPFSPEYAVCVTNSGSVIGSVSELSALGEKATGCGDEAPDEERPPMPEEGHRYVPPSDAAPPASFDWRSYLGSDWLSPIKSQGGCGSCWAFAAVGVAEAAHNIASNNPNLDLDLSEQYLVADCSSSGTCCGGSKSSALRYIRDSGVPDEACMNYVDGTGCSCASGTCSTGCSYKTGGSCSDRTCANRCSDWASRLTHVATTGYVGTDPQAIKQALVDAGPLAVSMGWGSDFGGAWDGDIYRCSSDTGTNHAVVIVGYSDAGGYWWVRNSWGTGWGDNGYFKLGYGECYVEQYVYYAEADTPDVGPLEYHSYTIDDDAIGDSSGNGDGVANCGENIELYVDLINQGTDAATGVSATIGTSDPYVTWLYNTSSSYPDITDGGTGTNSGAFDFALDPAAPNGHTIQFTLNISAGNGGPWSDSFAIPVSCRGDDYEPDNTWDQATWIADGAPQAHSIVPVGDVDWVKFSLSAWSEVVLETSGASGDTRMWLYDSYHDEVEFDDDGGTNLFSRIDRRCGEAPLPPGEYSVRIDDYGSNDEIEVYDITYTLVQACDFDHSIHLPVIQRSH